MPRAPLPHGSATAAGENVATGAAMHPATGISRPLSYDAASGELTSRSAAARWPMLAMAMPGVAGRGCLPRPAGAPC